MLGVGFLRFFFQIEGKLYFKSQVSGISEGCFGEQGNSQIILHRASVTYENDEAL